MAAETPPRVRLTRLSGARSGEAIELPGAAVRIGSSPHSDVKFDAAEHVASIHAKIVFGHGAHWLYDNRNDDVATFVNGVKIQHAQLADGDELRFGEAGPLLRFEQVAPEPHRPATLVFDKAKLQAHAEPALRASTEHALDRPVTGIGRAPGNAIVLDHPQVSSFHAEVVREGDRHVLVDRKSANGTFVANDRVTRHLLAEDDVVRIGPVQLVYHAGKLHAFTDRAASTIDVVHVSKVVGDGITLLDDVSLRIGAGELVGLIGPSGAGKSTLLGVLNGLRGATRGRVLVNGLDLVEHYESLKSFMGFVPQDDIIHPELSAERTLHYVSLLRLPADTTKDERAGRIAEVLQLLELTERKDVPIHRLSGGQRKRVSIGVELLTEPQLIFLDEPTAGLDPALEAKMMVLFKELASRGKTVLVTTHVMENVQIFDKLLVMVRGKLAFYGTPDEAKAHFGLADVRGLYDRLATATPAEWRDRFAATPLHERHSRSAEGLAPSGASAAILKRRRRSGGPLAALRQLAILARRQGEILLRDRRNTALLLLQAPVVGAFIALAMDSPALITFMLALSAIWFGTTNAAKEIVKELPIYRRERMVNLGLLPYVASKALVLSLISVVQCLLLLAVVDAGRHVPGDVVAIYLTLLLGSMTGVTTGLAISAFVETTDKATALVPLVLIPQVLFAGIFTPLTGLSGAVGMAMPTRWSYDLLKRVVMATHSERHPPLLGDAEKTRSEEELLALEQRSRGLVAEIDSRATVATGAVHRIAAARQRVDAKLVELSEHEAGVLASYDRSRAAMETIEAETAAIASTLGRQRVVLDELTRDLARLHGGPGGVRELLSPASVEAWRGRLEEAGAAYRAVERAAASIDASKQLLLAERAALEARGRDAREIERALRAAKQEVEAEGALVASAAAEIQRLEAALKSDVERIREVQAEVAGNLRESRYVQLHPRDSIGVDVGALGACCALLALVTLGLQKLRDREG